MRKHFILILYGSETGTAQDAAEQILEMALQRGYNKVAVDSLLYYDAVKNPPDADILIFCVSTTGDGEVPSNMKSFWKSILHKSIDTKWIRDVKFAVFGLGDSSYAKYNVTARKLNTRLLQLGASELIARELGDDQHPLGYFGAYNPWLESLWEKLASKYPPPFKANDQHHESKWAERRPMYDIRFEETYEDEGRKVPLKDPESSSFFYTAPENTINEKLGIIRGSVICNSRLTASDWIQDVRHVEIDINDEGIQYSPGDIAVIYPENTDEIVAELIAYVSERTNLALKTDSILAIHQNAVDNDTAPRNRYSGRFTLGTLLKKYLDIAGTPRRGFFAKISHFATSEDERDKLLELASPEGADLLYSYCVRERKSYVEVLQDFPSTRVPLNVLLELIPPQRPRSYSIASSSRLHPGTVHLCVAIVSFITPYKRKRYGVCSRYIRSLMPGQRVHLYIKTGIISTLDLTKNLILIGPGTGIAPLRAIVQERHSLRSIHQELVSQQSQLHLYFGCRHESKDFLYREELQHYKAVETLTELYTAFSRDQNHKIYIQMRMAENSKSIYQHIMSSGICIISGSAKQMPVDIHDTIVQILQTEGDMSKLEAERVLKHLIRNRLYIVETW